MTGLIAQEESCVSMNPAVIIAGGKVNRIVSMQSGIGLSYTPMSRIGNLILGRSVGSQ